ncbi:MAG: long-chain-fatty-acid--CoA ligase, partial [Proteobacteria bacterium]|nr:long-chain-fatty-acid--CoA ligase [Pseudomonadota bacterium]
MAGKEFVWFKHYQKNVPHEVDYTSEYSSLVDIFQKSCQKYSELPAFSNMGTSINYSELAVHVDHFCSYLQHFLGVKKGDRLAIM